MITTLLSIPLSIYVLWLFYLALMNVRGAQKRNELTKPAFVLAAPLLAIGGTVDILVNMIPFTLIMLEIPRELTVTARLKRHVNENSWRGSIARTLGKHVLNPFDPSGNHLD